ncbi:MAG: hypothetical protein EAZ65_00875 [Verrucomicrobia bacterium]|nr:MAG: hypothetical protein EAZ84_11475 [Verrucomicrobiota bacterium]TAE89237.1 MAG: hypothetical protein EAZ82_01020 [Verrucomicrobiota bacterium]TAF27888.1 MAG: hypothetical protein EAZ71_00880 [Verrucomicrobiota bacterium]TAF42737.1 MAG: hypothetical protein EAZ65_00875 [Verrucomicrobiota bacterium]
MKNPPTTALLILAALVATGTPLAIAKPRDANATVELSDERRKLERSYSTELQSLRGKIADGLPVLEARDKRAYLDAVRAGKAAESAIGEAQSRLDRIKGAKGLVDHAKGKWIGGADRGIATAKARLAKAATDAERKAARDEVDQWEKNRAEGVAALKERSAALEQAERERPAAEKQLAAAKDALATANAASIESIRRLDLEGILASDRLDGLLAKHSVLTEATPAGLAKFAQQGPEHEKLVGQLLADEKLMLRMLVADGAEGGRYGEAMRIYTDIRKSGDKSGEGVLERLALAVALDHAVPNPQRNAEANTGGPAFVDPVKRYLHFEKAFLAGELDPSFKDLGTWDLRMVVDGEEPDEILAWGRRMLRNYRPDHITTPDAAWRYVALVRTEIPYGSQDNIHDQPELHFFQNILKNGGVCGRRAFIGRFLLRAFGVPTTARPQKGHAALAHWTPDGWVVCLGGGWGSGWTKTPYDRDLDFLATTQARALGDAFLRVKRAQWIGDAMGEPRSFGLITKKEPAFWNGVSLHTQRALIEASKAKTLASVGEDIAEATESKAKEKIVPVEISDEDRRIVVDTKGVITLPAAATRNPTRSTGKILFLESMLGGKQLHYSRTTSHQPFEYAFDATAAGKYRLTARVATPSWKQNLKLVVNDKGPPIDLPLPFTLGLWENSESVEIDLVQGPNVLRFTREGNVKGVSIRDFTLTPEP